MYQSSSNESDSETSTRFPSISELPLSSHISSLFEGMKEIPFNPISFPSISLNTINSSRINVNNSVSSTSIVSKPEISNHSSNISSVSSPNCLQDTPHSTSQSHSKSSWSPAEDEILLNAVSGKTNINWDYVASIDGKHTPKQCRERWLVKLNPEVRRSPFEPWEDELIQSERQKIGNHWSLIAQLLPGRTSCSVKNRWYTVLRYKPMTFPYFPNFAMATMRPPVKRNVLC
ncbi:Myb-like DNA-binding domain containing protein [Tritrichomonas foetus]|uniref:Myb-like DNA-binding domain containing protein n=1 Tax=Tritrichomonas foetus TaxID=1144522 RepID=A0A1J4JJM7_9EUKA|nr:Myb-like DNA-binding domain containing protein [Tritrichomonas foetus]|eukprot:OHS97715.1 Myb-like DNA-binding domain containing protein [Tritrichomonas foetus]